MDLVVSYKKHILLGEVYAIPLNDIVDLTVKQDKDGKEISVYVRSRNVFSRAHVVNV